MYHKGEHYVTLLCKLILTRFHDSIHSKLVKKIPLCGGCSSQVALVRSGCAGDGGGEVARVPFHRQLDKSALV